MYCIYCGRELPDDAIYCSQCGKRLTPQTNEPIQSHHMEDKVTEQAVFTDLSPDEQMLSPPQENSADKELPGEETCSTAAFLIALISVILFVIGLGLALSSI